MAAKYRVLLPKTKFPLRVNPSHQEPSVQKAAGFSHLYKWQLDRPDTKGDFTLHDGPPYANGKPHMGHVLNKVLKDVINRYKLMQGFRVHYRPGWDCHGLPIELKACKESDFLEASPQEIRQKAAKFAQKTIELQKEAFQRWGCMGDWGNPYLTMDPAYEADQVRVFYRMYQQGCIYRGFKPVYWSPSSGTALAEAELEYQDHTSRAVYVLFPIVPGTATLLPQISDFSSNDDNGGGVFVLVWTTTPWTLAANKAICFNPEHSYSLIQIGAGSEKKRVLVGSECLQRLGPILGEYSILCTLLGLALEGLKYRNPLDTLLQQHNVGVMHRPFLSGDHVTETEGSGLVHTAPAHGFEDHLIGVHYSLELGCVVNDKGMYTNEVGPTLKNRFVLREGNETVISELRASGALVHESSYTHRYPYDWRTKKPVIIRSTEQWFASVAALKEKAKSALNDVKMYPSFSLNRLTAFLEARNDWCISRQRVWGVPLPIFYDHETGEPLIKDETIEHIEATFRQRGSDSWWSMTTSDLLPPSLRQEAHRYTKETDIMDVWFDSGSSWSSVLKDTGCVADLYLEGSDQHRGWFQSSLLTSVAAQGRAPYRNVITHGFVLDSKANKMSKSLGNVISPDDILKSGKQFGADTMRLWAAFSNYSSDVHISDDILQQTNNFLQKIRITCRFALGNLSSFDPTSDLLPYPQLSSLDRYVLHLLSCYASEATQAYESFNFTRLQSLLNKLIPKDLSAFYFEIIKDRLYCNAQRSTARRSTLTALYHILQCLTKSIAPILPHLAEEVARHSSGFVDGMLGNVIRTTLLYCSYSHMILLDQNYCLKLVMGLGMRLSMPFTCMCTDRLCSDEDRARLLVHVACMHSKVR